MKVQLSMCSPWRTVYMANTSIAPFILNLSTGWRWVVSFKLQPLYCQKRNPGTHWTEGSVGARGGLGISKREKIPWPCLVNTTTTLSHLLQTSCSKKIDCSYSCKKQCIFSGQQICHNGPKSWTLPHMWRSQLSLWICLLLPVLLSVWLALRESLWTDWSTDWTSQTEMSWHETEIEC
jgi:hypothetical protein